MFGKTKVNHWLDALIFATFVITALTGLMFWLLLPEGQGSSRYVFLGLSKSAWTDVHNWAGLSTLIGVGIHLLLHWKWISCVFQRFFSKIAYQARVNFSLNVLLFGAFILVNLSGLVAWLALPSGGYRGGRNLAYRALWLGFSRHEWSDLHLWSGLASIIILIIHIALHWKWITSTLRRYVGGISSSIQLMLKGSKNRNFA